MGINSTFSLAKQNTPVGGGGGASPLTNGIFLPNAVPVYDLDENFQMQYDENGKPLYNFKNPIFQDMNVISFAQTDKYATNTYRVLVNPYVDFNFYGVHWKTSLSYDYINLDETQWYNAEHGNGKAAQGRLYKYAIWNNTFGLTSTLNYNFNIKEDHHFSVLAGYEIYNKEYKRTYAQGTKFPIGGLTELNVAATPQEVGSVTDKERMLSYFGRLNYDYQNKYFASFSIRSDGSSRFAPGHRYGTFWSVGLNWRISEENFMKDITWLDDLKLRASYGETGSQAITAYQSLASFSTTSYVLNGSSAVALVPGRVPNPDLKWETTKQTDIGIDLSVLGGRISLVADYYYKKTVDLHYDKILPYYTGYSSQTQNIGSKSNKGWEFSLNTQNLVGDFKWSTSLNIALNREKVLDLGDDEYFYTNGSGGALGAGFNETGIVKVGEPLGNFYGYVFDGIYQNEAEAKALGLTKDDVGSVKFKDLNGDNKITTEDRTIIGNANPDFIFGIGNDFSYKNFDLSFMFQGTYGNDVYNLLKVTFSELPSNSNNTGNAFAFVKDSWRGEGTSNTQQAFNKGVGPSSSRFVEDGSYIRLKNLTFGYTLPKSVTSKWGISNLRFYLSGQNLFTITGYSGYDPEVSSRTGNYNLGFDGGSYPATRSYTFGLNLTL